MQEIKLYKTILKGSKVLAGGILFVIALVWVLSLPDTESFERSMAWVGIIFFGSGILVGIFHILDRRPQIIITETGIWDRTTKQDAVKWEQILGASTLEIFEQRFVSVRTDKTFVFKKKPYKWVTKVNKALGASDLNLNLSQTNIDEKQLVELIEKLRKAPKEDRSKLIQECRLSSKHYSKFDFLKIGLYILASIVLLILSLSSFVFLFIILIISAIAAFYTRWYRKTNVNSKLYKYAQLVTYFGFANMIFWVITLQTYKYTTNDIGVKISTEIENYKSKFYTYPSNLESINTTQKFNFIERYLANKIDYRVTGNNYELNLTFLFNKQRKYSKLERRWK